MSPWGVPVVGVYHNGSIQLTSMVLRVPDVFMLALYLIAPSNAISVFKSS